MKLDEVIEILKANCNFTDTLTAEDSKYKIIQPLQDDNIQFEHFYGATKIVLLFPNCDFVIKIPFSGYEDYEYGYESFLYATDSEDEWNYCETEANRYKMAKFEGFEEAFAKTEEVTRINGYPIYKQEKAVTLSEDERYNSGEKQHTEKEEQEAEELEDTYCTDLSSFWICDAIAYYGKEFVKKLLDFLNWNEFTDLHSSNIGYIDNIPVLIDYAGYNE